MSKIKSGRPRISYLLERIQCRRNYRLPRWLVLWLDKQKESSGRLIERALKETNRLRGPQDEKKEEQD